MGTRSTVKFYENHGQHENPERVPVACIYQQYDGYLDGVGLELAQFLAGITMINGFGINEKAGTHANGIGCLAAQYIKQHKSELGGFYMTTPEDSQEYNYEVFMDQKGELIIRERSEGITATPQQFVDMFGDK